MIPRPATAERGGPAPWRPRTRITLAAVVDGLGRAGLLLAEGPPAAAPGPAAPPEGRAARPHPDPAAAPEGRAPLPVAPAAVLIALFEEDGEARVLLTRRSVQLRTHRGQVSFPGGRIEEGETAVQAALREAFEEVGLDPDAARPFARLPEARAFATGAPITPVVAALGRRPLLVPNPAEVERAFDASLAELAASYWSERWSQPGRPALTVHFFEAAGETVWGATARMLVELLTLALGGA